MFHCQVETVETGLMAEWGQTTKMNISCVVLWGQDDLKLTFSLEQTFLKNQSLIRLQQPKHSKKGCLVLTYGNSFYNGSISVLMMWWFHWVTPSHLCGWAIQSIRHILGIFGCI